MFDLLTAITEVLRGTLDSPWLWLLVFAVAGLDALLPFMPSETTVVLVAVLIGPDPVRLVALVLVAGIGALAGDCLSYWTGRGAAPKLLARLRRAERGRRRYAWARAKVDQHAPLLILAARYLPGGRVASGLATGSMSYPWRRFVVLDALGAGLWAAYSTLIGYVGGASYADEPAKGVLLAFALALLVVAAIELGRRLRLRLRSRRGPRELPRSDPDALRGTARGGDRSGPGRPGADLSEVDSAETGRPSGPGALLGPRRGRGAGRGRRQTRSSA